MTDPGVRAFLIVVQRADKVRNGYGEEELIWTDFTSAYAIGQMYLDSAVRKNLELKTYAAGHMIYTHDDTRAALFHDAQAFFRAAAPAGTQ